jgi:hypothetical protein
MPDYSQSTDLRPDLSHRMIAFLPEGVGLYDLVDGCGNRYHIIYEPSFSLAQPN